MVAPPSRKSDKAKRLEILNQGNNPFPQNVPPPPQQQRPPFQQSPQRTANSKQPQSAPGRAPAPTHRRVTSADLARQYDFEKQNIIKFCFAKVDPDGSLHESYISHVRIIEDSHYPSSAPELGVKSTGHLKPRVLMLGVKKSGRVRIHKGRENTDGTFQIGRTWDLDELAKVEQLPNPCGFVLGLGKLYYWQTNSPMERFVFLKTLLSTYSKYTGGKFPELLNVDLAHLNITRANSLKSSNSMKYNTAPTAPTATPPLPTLSTRQSQTKSLRSSNSVTSPTTQEKVDNYKNIDFTASGKLPVKPMVALDVAKPNIQNTSPIITPTKSKPHPIVIPPNIKANIPIVTNPAMAPSSRASAEPLKSSQRTETAPLNTTYSRESATSGYSSRKGSLAPIDQISTNSSQDLSTRVNTVEFKSSKSTPKPSPDTKKSTPVHPYKQFQESSPLANRDHESSIEEIDVIEFKGSNDKIDKLADTKDKVNDSPAVAELGNGAKRLRGIALNIMKKQAAMTAFNKAEQDEESKVTLKPPTSTSDLIPPRSPDFGIEEIEDSDNEASQIQKPNLASKDSAKSEKDYSYYDDITNDSDEVEDKQVYKLSGNKVSDKQLAETGSISSVDEEFIDNIPDDDPEVYDMVKAKRASLFDPLEDPLNEQGPEKDASTLEKKEKSKSAPKYKYERKSEMEEIFDDIHWTSSDTAETLIKKLNKELNQLKYANVEELINFNFKLDSADSDVGSSMKEVNELNMNLKNLNLDFKLISQEIASIENDSQGLQVKSINKKHLYNDLKEILNKVDMNTEDLKFIQRFQDFTNFSQLGLLEEKLIDLYNAIKTIRSDNDTDASDDLSSMDALKQYQQNYGIITTNFITNFTMFIKGMLSKIIDRMGKNISAFDVSNLEADFNKLLVYSGFLYFINDISLGGGISEILDYFISKSSALFKSLLSQNLKSVSFSHISYDLNIDDKDVEEVGLKKSRTLRFTDRKDRIKEKLGSMADISVTSRHSLLSHSSPSPPLGSGTVSHEYVPESIDFVVNIINETRDIIVAEQIFLIKFFHLSANSETYPEYVSNFPVSKIAKLLNGSNSTPNSTNYSNDLVTSMSSVFDEYLEMFLKEITPNTINLPILLITLEKSGIDYNSSNQEYLNSKFIKKVSDKFKYNWTKFIENQVKILNKSSINKNGIMKSIKNFNHLINMVENSIKASTNDSRNTAVRGMLNDSYQKLSDAIVSMLMKNDPLLKDSDYDEKQRLHHNISLIQNMYYLAEELNDFNVQSLVTIRSNFRRILGIQIKSYFSKINSKPLGKLIEFIENIESLTKENISINVSKSKVYNKSSTKKLLVNYDLKEIRSKVELLFKKLEKNYLVNNTDYERKLINKLWGDMRNEFIDIFARLNSILSNHYKDIDYHVTKQEIISIFISVTQ